MRNAEFEEQFSIIPGSALKLRHLQVAPIPQTSYHAYGLNRGPSFPSSSRQAGIVGAQKFTEQFQNLFDLSAKLSRSVDADALLILLEGPTDWQRLKTLAGEEKILIAADFEPQVAGAAEALWHRLRLSLLTRRHPPWLPHPSYRRGCITRPT